MTIRSKSILFLLLAVVLMTSSAEASSPRARQTVAVIETINRDKRTLSLSYPQRRGPREVTWYSDTRFLRDWKSVPATELREGTHVTVYFHSPFFGRPYATKVVWTGRK